MRTFRRAIYALLMSAVLLTVNVVFAVPVSAENNRSRIISGTFEYLPSSGSELRSGTYFYSDTYFSSPASSPDEHLRTMSLCLALTAFGAYGPDNAEYTKKVLIDTGFDAGSIAVGDMNVSSSSDTIGTVIAHKTTEYGEVTAVVIRGGYYGLEWENTLNVGESGDASGIASAAEKVAGRIKAYEREHGLSGSKLWISGYSRGGAAADLVGRYINEHLTEFGIKADDAYIYTFEAPSVSESEAGYTNIRNVYVSDDIIPMFFPGSWGLHSSGTAERIEGNGADIRRKFFDGTDIVDAYTYTVGSSGLPEKKTEPPISCETAASGFVSWLASVCGRSYFARYSPYISRTVGLFVSGQGKDTERLASYLGGALSDAFSGTAVRLRVIGYLSVDIGDKSDERAVAYISGRITDALSSKSYSDVLTDAEYERLISDIPQLVRFLLPIVRADFDISSPLSNICTFISNIGDILFCHRHESVLSLVMAKDAYYSPEPLSDAVISVDETTAQVISVELNGKRLTEGLDHIVSFRDSTGNTVIPEKSGKYTAVVTGIGCYSGTAEKEFIAVFPHIHEWVIISACSTVTVKCVSEDCDDYGTGKEYTVTLSAADKEYDGLPAAISSSVSEGFPAEIEVSGTGILDGAGKKMTDPAEPGKYTVQAVVYDRGDPSNKADMSLRFEISRIDITERTTVTFAENSAEIVSAYCGGRELENGTDFELSYYRGDGTQTGLPEKPGNYFAMLVGRGHYTGSYRAFFEIKWRPDMMFFVAVGCAVLAVIVAFAVLIRKGRKRKN